MFGAYPHGILKPLVSERKINMLNLLKQLKIYTDTFYVCPGNLLTFSSGFGVGSYSTDSGMKLKCNMSAEILPSMPHPKPQNRIAIPDGHKNQ